MAWIAIAHHPSHHGHRGRCKGEKKCSHGIECALPDYDSSLPMKHCSAAASIYKATDMADLFLAHDLVAFKRHLCHAFLKPEMLSEVRHELLELLAG